MARELYDLFGSGNDAAVREFKTLFAGKERRWNELTAEIEALRSLNKTDREVANLEYGYVKDGVGYPPIPFIRKALKTHKNKWDAKTGEAALRFAFEDDEKCVKALADEIRSDIYNTALEEGVPKHLADEVILKARSAT